MRRFGMILVILGALGFFYSSSRLEESQPLPADISVSAGLRYPAGQWELARFGACGAAAVGFLLALFPKGR